MERKVISDQMVLKAVLLLRRWGNKSQSKEEQIAQEKRWLAEDPTYRDGYEEWIESLKEDLAKSPEQREEGARIASEELAEAEAEYDAKMAREEMEWLRHERDEWDDLWADRARSVGAVMW